MKLAGLLFVFCFLTFNFVDSIVSQLRLNVQNNAGEIFTQTIAANTTSDTVALNFLGSDGIYVELLIDFKSELQVFKLLIPGEADLGDNTIKRVCYVLQFSKDEFISSDTMAKMRQRNPNNIRVADEQSEEVLHELDLALAPAKSGSISPHIPDFCRGAITYTSEADLKNVAKVTNRRLPHMTVAASALPHDPTSTCNHATWPRVNQAPVPCTCRWRTCVEWLPCGLRYCQSKQKDGTLKNYRCGIRTCRQCRQFQFAVKAKQDCMLDGIH